MTERPALSGLRKQKSLQGKEGEVVWSAYKHTFLKDETSRTVLAHMCLLAGFFGFASGQEDMIRQNFMKQVLSNCGIWSDKKSLDIIRKLSELI